MQRLKLDIEQLKKLVASYQQGFQIQIRTEEFKHLAPDYEDDDEYDAPVIYVPGPCCPDSASYFGLRDVIIWYSDYNASFYDDPEKTIADVTATYEAIQDIRDLMTKLKEDGYQDVALMAPRARSVDGDNHVFMIGFNARN